MCERCVESGRMTEAEVAQQREEMNEILAVASVQQMSEEFVSVLAQFGYGISIGLLDSGNIAVGLTKSSEKGSGPVAGDGYVLAEFSADSIRKILEVR